MEILIDCTYSDAELEELPIEQLAEFVIAQVCKPENTEVSISFVSNDDIAELNQEYREKHVS